MDDIRAYHHDTPSKVGWNVGVAKNTPPIKRYHPLSPPNGDSPLLPLNRENIRQLLLLTSFYTIILPS